ncbi:hypothetical protein Tco_0651359, partial [Tanacetum coccineum]
FIFPMETFASDSDGRAKVTRNAVRFGTGSRNGNAVR